MMQTKTNVFLWALYDFANSIVSIVFFLYFAQWIVIERHFPDFYFNLTFTISAMLLLCTVPVTGVLLDRTWRRITGLRYTTIGTGLCYGGCALSALFNHDVSALIFFTLGLYAYLLSFTFYTPLVHDVASQAKKGFVSGVGVAANYSGQIVGLLLALPFSKGTLSFFDGSPRAETLLPAVIVFLIISLPTLLFFREPKKAPEQISLRRLFSEVFLETKAVFLVRNVAYFLLAYFLFNDAVLTAANNFPIFLEQVWGVSDTTKTYILLGILITSAIGGGVSGMIADRFGHKKTLQWILVGWIIILPLVGLLTNFTLFVVATTLMGFWFGANWAVSRSLMSHIASEGKHNLTFAYFGLVERASSFVGPLVWSLTLSGLISLGSDRYRFATLTVSVFIVLGLFALNRVVDQKKV